MTVSQSQPFSGLAIYGVIPMGHGRLLFTPELTSCRPVAEYLQCAEPRAVIHTPETMLQVFGETVLKKALSIHLARYSRTNVGQLCIAVAKPIDLLPDFDATDAYRDGSQRFVACDALFALAESQGDVYYLNNALACSAHKIVI